MADETQTNGQRQRVLSGMRPTGKLHLGNYMGALFNWVKLQHEFECYFFIADLHALTTNYENTAPLRSDILEVAVDFWRPDWTRRSRPSSCRVPCRSMPSCTRC